MKKIYLITAFVFFSTFIFAQATKDAAVELWAKVQTAPPTVTLNWVNNATSTNYAIARKLKSASTWVTLTSILSGTTTQFVDNTVAIGTNYEYRVIRSGTSGTVNYSGYGYINCGIEVPVTENRGKLILVIANTLSTSLAPEIKRLEDDLEGDGWDVIKTFVSTTLTPIAVKAITTNTYNLDPNNTKALFLLGDIPVPYSGNLYPDAHTDHIGAWPADVYYGDMDGTWTDVSVTSTPTNAARIVNVPGDGKFDQTVLPSDVDLQVGRVDLSAMPTFTASETQLLKNYLDKDHEYRKKIFTPIKRAVIDDNFGYFGGEAFAANGWKNFAPLVTPTNVAAGDYFTSMAAGNSYQWSYGCGGGSYTSAGGIGNTANFAAANLGGVFTILFGSYFGDWDVNNSFLRAPLCQGKTLTNFWAGRPHWALHHMGLGETIGYSTKQSQNNPNIYFYAYGGAPSGNPPRVIHSALMGDPTLRNDIVAPVANVVATKVADNCNINWTASTQTNVLGYNIYMKNDTNKTYTKINTSLIAGTSYVHNCLQYPGIYKYMVRALVLENTPSGTYYNMSEGIADTALNNTNLTIYANAGAITSGTSSAVNFTATTVGGTSFNWAFGDGATSTSQNPSHTYTLNGNYTATLVVSRGCNSITLTIPVGISTNLQTLQTENNILVFPNPSKGIINLNLDNPNQEVYNITVYNQQGKIVHVSTTNTTSKTINLNEVTKGLYLIQLQCKHTNITRKIIIE